VRGGFAHDKSRNDRPKSPYSHRVRSARARRPTAPSFASSETFQVGAQRPDERPERSADVAAELHQPNAGPLSLARDDVPHQDEQRRPEPCAARADEREARRQSRGSTGETNEREAPPRERPSHRSVRARARSDLRRARRQSARSVTHRRRAHHVAAARPARPPPTMTISFNPIHRSSAAKGYTPHNLASRYSRVA